MPITIKQNKVKFKDPTQQGYIEFNAVGDKTTSQLKQELQETADAIRTNWPDNYDNLTEKVNNLVKFQSSQPPTDSTTQIWVDTSNEIEQIGIPTLEDFNEFKDNIRVNLSTISISDAQLLEHFNILVLDNCHTIQIANYNNLGEKTHVEISLADFQKLKSIINYYNSITPFSAQEMASLRNLLPDIETEPYTGDDNDEDPIITPGTDPNNNPDPNSNPNSNPSQQQAPPENEEPIETPEIDPNNYPDPDPNQEPVAEQPAAEQPAD